MSFKSQPHADDEPTAGTARKSHPLFWLLVLVALLTLVWAVYSHYASESPSILAQTTSMGSASRPIGRLVDRSRVRPGRDTRPLHP